MQISSRMTTAVHILCFTDFFSEIQKIISEDIAESAGVNPVVIRRLMGQLRAAGLIRTDHSRGIVLKKPLKKITLLDVYRAVETSDAKEGIFRFPPGPDQSCPVGGAIQPVLKRRLKAAQKAMEKELKLVTLDMVQKEIRRDYRRRVSEHA